MKRFSDGTIAVTIKLNFFFLRESAESLRNISCDGIHRPYKLLSKCVARKRFPRIYNIPNFIDNVESRLISVNIVQLQIFLFNNNITIEQYNNSAMAYAIFNSCSM